MGGADRAVRGGLEELAIVRVGAQRMVGGQRGRRDREVQGAAGVAQAPCLFDGEQVVDGADRPRGRDVAGPGAEGHGGRADRRVGVGGRFDGHRDTPACHARLGIGEDVLQLRPDLVGDEGRDTAPRPLGVRCEPHAEATEPPWSMSTECTPSA